MVLRKVFFVTLLCSFFIVTSCSESGEVQKNENKDAPELVLPTLESVTEENNEFVVVLFGYGYNEGESKEELLNQLSAEYGLAENGGIIIPFVYPDDFDAYGYERISLLTDNIEAELLELTGEVDITKVAAVVTLGAPEGTHYALAEIQDSGYDAVIFSVFSQDDILGTEAGSTLVIDYSMDQAAQDNRFEHLGELDLSFPANVFDIISPLINASFDWNGIDETGLFIPALRTEYKKTTSYNFFVFVDPQTGLRAQNHYVLTQQELND